MKPEVRPATRRSAIARLALTAAAFGSIPALAEEAKSGDWTVLLGTGDDLSAWKVPADNPFWSVRDGVLTGTNDEALRGSTLYTVAEFGDFELEAEASWEGEIDSGILFRKPELQLQIGVSRSLKRDLTGSFYTGGAERYPEAGRTKDPERFVKDGRWVKFRLTARGDEFSVHIDDQLTVDRFKAPKYSGKGPIGLQIHGGLKMSVKFRNIRIRPL